VFWGKLQPGKENHKNGEEANTLTIQGSGKQKKPQHKTKKKPQSKENATKKKKSSVR